MSENQTKVAKTSSENNGFKLPVDPKALIPANKNEWIRFGEGAVVAAGVVLLTQAIVSLVNNKKPESKK